MTIPSTASARPFDGAAATYDATFTQTRLGRRLREAVRTEVEPLFRPGDHVLELGCGTGEDAVWLARRGVRVTATDASPAMLDIARRKTDRTGVAARVHVTHLDLASTELRRQLLNVLEESTRELIPNPRSQIPDPKFDAVFSNFGVLNCLRDRRPLADALAAVVAPGGYLALVVMGPLCPWEMVWHAAHGDLRSAVRRFRDGAEAHVGGGETVRVWYPSPRRLRSEVAPHFRHLRTVGIGTLLPPSYLGHLVERWPRFFDAVAALDRRVGRVFPGTWLNDHYLAVFDRRDDGRWTVDDGR